jgi:hypothetical protein
VAGEKFVYTFVSGVIVVSLKEAILCIKYIKFKYKCVFFRW